MTIAAHASVPEEPQTLSPREVLDRHAATFAAASRLLAPGAHDEIAILYQFCRTVDDLADESGDVSALEQMIREIRGDTPPSPLVADLQKLAHKGAPLEAAVQLIEGCRSDVGVVRYETEDELIRYGYRVAGTVGRLCCPLLGVTDARAEAFAVDLGIAMQLTNIARDVAEDAARDRVYLPKRWLAEQDLSARDVIDGRHKERTAKVVARLLDLAERYYRSADAGLRYIPLRARIAVALAARRYRGIGLATRARGAAAVGSRTVLGPRQRLFYLLSAPLVALRLGWTASKPHLTENQAPLAGLYP